MDKGYKILFHSINESIEHLQTGLAILQKGLLDAEECYIRTPSKDDEVEE